ncbi:hypothetical protein [Notoacmeibacter ruber]|uniref:Argininosuccinate lyase n=1 Tax=Notoacmeibacter ruber TaxID=2670375 RepID=A0A3L7JCZ4_9HYPH|nr:hypothetical protein [Notoacmeibacter ruber]RLQ88617.1 hypothetical protein D8780_10745 [Notoacmeibacter ruber]
MMRLPSLTLLTLIAGALAVSACGRRADLEKPTASAPAVEEDQRIAGPLAVPLGREDATAARTAAAQLEDGTLETQESLDTSRDDSEKPSRPFFLDRLVE